MMKRNIWILVMATLMFCCKQLCAQVVVHPKPSIYGVSEQFGSLKVNGQDIPIIKAFDNYDYAHFSFNGSISLEIAIAETIASYNISPLVYEIRGTLSSDQKKLSFNLAQSRYLIVKINSKRDLIIVADALETDVPNFTANTTKNVTLAPYNADNTGGTLATSAIQQAIDDVSVSGGVVYLPAGIYLCKNLVLKNNTSIYLAGGAVIRASTDTAGYTWHFKKNNLDMWGTRLFTTVSGANNIKIYGRGTIDGNGDSLRITKGRLNSLMVPIGTNNFTLDGITFRDSGLWGVTPARCTNVVIKNTKHFNINNNATSSHENDAVDIQECTDVKITHAIMISEDDTFSTKTWQGSTDIAAGWYGTSQPVKNVTVDDCVAWSRCATYKVGFGNFEDQSNIVIKNSVSYRSMKAIAVNLRYGDAVTKNVTFDNIDIEAYWPRNGTSSQWLDIYTAYNRSGTWLYGGYAKFVTIKNINVRTLGSIKSRIDGFVKSLSDTLFVDGVSLINIKMPGKTSYAATLAEMDIENNEFVKNINFYPNGNLALGKTTTSSADISSTYAASKATDGLESSEWRSINDNYEWLKVDLGKNFDLEKIIINWGGAAASNYQVEFSTDNINWAIVRTISDNRTFINSVNNLSGVARYVKIYCSGRLNMSYFSIREISIYGKNLAKGRPVVTNSTPATGYNASYAVDDNPITQWRSPNSNYQELWVDLGSTYDLDRVAVNWGEAFAKNSEIYTSTDGSSWTLRRSLNNNTSYFNVIESSLGYGRYVKVKGTGRSSGNAYFSISELEIYGSYRPAGTGTLLVADNNPLHLDGGAEDKVVIYPNPVLNGTFTVSYRKKNLQKMEYTITDIAGRIVMRKIVQNFSGDLQVNLPAGTSPGTYILNLSGVKYKIIILN